MNGKSTQNKIEPIGTFLKPLWLFAITIFSIFVAEALVMFFMELTFSSHSLRYAIIIDSLLLSCILFLPLYFLLLRPMMKYVQSSKETEGEILEYNKALRAEVEERIKVESDLKLFRDLINQTQDSVLVIDPETGKILDINNSVCVNLGYSKDELLNKRVADIDGILTDKYLWKEHVNRVKYMGSFITEGEHVRKDGTIFSVEKNVKLVIEGGKQYIITVVRDITERRKSEAALQALVESTLGGEGQEFFDKIVSSLCNWLDVDVVSIGGLDANGTVVDVLSMQVDSEIVKDFSYSLAGTPCEHTMNDGYCVHVSGICEKFPEDQDLVEMGAEGYMGMALLDKTGKPIGILNAVSKRRLNPPRSAKNVLRIIAGRISIEMERLRAERELKTLSQAVEQSPVTILITDAEGSIEYVNTKFTEVTGYTVEEVIGEKPSLLKSGTQPPELYEQLWKTITSGQDWKGELQNKTKNGELYWEDAIISPVLDSSGTITHYLAVKEDISERKKAQESLRASEERYRTLFEDSLDVVFIASPGGKLLDINAAGVELFGYSGVEEMLELNLADDIYKNSYDRELLVAEIESRGFVRDFEVVMRKKDGTDILASITSSALYDSNGKSMAYRGIIRDQTANKRLEGELLQAQKMEAIGQLAGGVAHDFNNILTSMVLFTHLAMERIGQDHAAYDDLKQIFSSAERAKDLTRQLLIFSRKQPIKCVPLSVNESVNGLSKMLNRLIGEDVDIVTDLSEDLKSIEADKGGIDQLIMNLTVNARDAMPDGGRIIIKTENVEIDAKACSTTGHELRPGSYVCISVSDAGEGIDANTLTRIFDPFFTTKEKGKGTGLGLAVVHGIIRKHGGCIDVKSAPGKGTTFSSYFPSSDKPPVRDYNTLIGLPKKVDGCGKRVLLVEDDDDVREPVAMLLGSNGYTVFKASNARAAREIFERENGEFSVVISDVIMPGGSGLKLVSDLKELNPKLNVLIMSGHMDEKSNWNLINERGYKFFSKPYTVKELLDAVHTLSKDTDNIGQT